MPSNITLVSVIFLFTFHLIRLYPKYIKNYKHLLIIIGLCLIIGIHYHYTSKLLLIDILFVAINLYFHYKYFPGIKNYILVVFIFVFVARLLHYKYGPTYLESCCTLIVHLMGHLMFFHAYNQLE